MVYMTNTTHSLEQVEALMWKESDILKDSNVGKDRKKEALKKLKLLERHFRDCQDKHTNGHKYAQKLKRLYDPTPQTKKQKEELLKLIDSVETDDTDPVIFKRDVAQDYFDYRLDLSGVSVGKDRFELVDKGW